MTILFESIKLIFFILTIFLAFVVTKGELTFGEERTALITQFLFPGYMVLVGLLVGYIIALFIIGNSKEQLRTSRIMTHMFLVGLILGAVFALLYIFAL